MAKDRDGLIYVEDMIKTLKLERDLYRLIETLFQVITKSKRDAISYTEFTNWFGVVIDPLEKYYFRKDMLKNPPYLLNQEQ